MWWTSWPEIENGSSQLHGDVSAQMQIVKNTFWHEKSFFDSFGFLLTEKERRHLVPGICEVIFWQLGKQTFPCQKSCFFSASFAGSTEMARKVMFPCLRKRRRSSVVWGCQPKYLTTPLLWPLHRPAWFSVSGYDLLSTAGAVRPSVAMDWAHDCASPRRNASATRPQPRPQKRRRKNSP